MQNVNKMDEQMCRLEISRNIIPIRPEEVTEDLLVKYVPGLTLRIGPDHGGMWHGEAIWKHDHGQVSLWIEPTEYRQQAMLRLSVLIAQMLDAKTREHVRAAWRANLAPLQGAG